MRPCAAGQLIATGFNLVCVCCACVSIAKPIEVTEVPEVIDAKPAEEEHYIQIFGAPLEEVLRRDGVEYKIPYIMRQIIDYIETNGMVAWSLSCSRIRLLIDRRLVGLQHSRFRAFSD
jgi:hypothetical protein